MSLPPGFLEELRNRLPLGRVVGRKVAWDGRKSNQAKGDLWAPCPFHQEKTASFHVDDRKGFFYCFGCHEKGDAIAFVQKTENLGFMEAVELLAREAGMPMPAKDPRAAEKASRTSQLVEVMEMAVRHYRLTLASRSGEQARSYLARRGLGPEALARWDIGWGGDDRQGLFAALMAKGIAPELMEEAGLTGQGQGGTYDRFWGRILFPIRDARGRTVAFGGRSLDPNARAKYLNSPQTALFDKGRTLFNHAPAREACGKGAQLIVAEGYMDVIALAEAGFAGAVAPLGTAVTEEQLALLWRLHPEPVMALDGDAAGLRAALRVVDLALPRLEAGKGLRFALLPGGQDPDELLRAGGAPAMQAVLDAAQPMVRLLWERETAGKVFDSPERKAALGRALQGAVTAIRDPAIRRFYDQALRDLQWELWGRRPVGPRDGRGGSRGATPALASSLAAGSSEPEDELRRAVLAMLVTTPALVPAFAHEVEALDCPDPGQAALRDAILRRADVPDLAAADLRAALAEELGEEAVGGLLASAHILAVRRPGEVDLVRLDVAEALAKLAARRSHEAALAEAVEDLGEADEWLTRRLGQAAAEVDVTRRKDTEDSREVVVFGNGLALDKQEKDRSDEVFARIDPSRGGRGGHRRGP